MENIKAMMTENEAKEKWCPYSIVHDRGAGINRTNDDDEPFDIQGNMCVASQCMAWRWVPDELQKFVQGETDMNLCKGKIGYCGLSGKP